MRMCSTMLTPQSFQMELQLAVLINRFPWDDRFLYCISGHGLLIWSVQPFKLNLTYLYPFCYGSLSIVYHNQIIDFIINYLNLILNFTQFSFWSEDYNDGITRYLVQLSLLYKTYKSAIKLLLVYIFNYQWNHLQQPSHSIILSCVVAIWH